MSPGVMRGDSTAGPAVDQGPKGVMWFDAIQDIPPVPVRGDSRAGSAVDKVPKGVMSRRPTLPSTAGKCLSGPSCSSDNLGNLIPLVSSLSWTCLK